MARSRSSDIDIGCFDLTKAAEQNNVENLLVTKSKKLVRICIENRQGRKEYQEKYEGRLYLLPLFSMLRIMFF